MAVATALGALAHKFSGPTFANGLLENIVGKFTKSFTK